ncbi:hypothetical protein NKR23_g8533 [Pleurostoma richardsiae]|uniref:Zn(2)-C6 fungal-type domain-containing protein n=1 Tax=Pleurostoma richardsiae TaxID=41990 RepID=A0AA38VLA5_9PEZI|nr:hypothetical protein NKR23_g8533 [Pleurostoma richardsiae]
MFRSGPFAEASQLPRPLAPRKPDANGRRQVNALNASERQRVRRACVECRVKKVKCNGADPCARCTSLSVACEYGEFATRNGGIADANHVEKLEARVASMEQMFRSFLEQFESIQANGNGGHASRAREDTPAVHHDAVGPTSEAPVPDPNPGTHASRMQQLLDAAEADAAGLNLPEPQDVSKESDSQLAEPSDGEVEQDDGNVEQEQADQGERRYADGFGELDVDTCGQLRYVGLGSTASVVDNCIGLRRHISKGLEKKGYEPEEFFFASPEALNIEDSEGSPPCQASASDLPPSDLVELLIDIYARELAFLFPITTERDIRQIYEKLSSQRERDPGYAAVFFALLAVAAPLLPEDQLAFQSIDAKWRSRPLGPWFHNEAMRHVNMPFRGKFERKGRSQDIVVALGLLSMYLAETGSQAEAWITVGRAIRNAQDLGLHRSPERLRLPMEERNKRRYIWWCLYILERQLCTALGRPLSIDDQDCDTEVPSAVSDGTQVNGLAGFTGMIHLHRIIGQILKIVNSVRNADAWRRLADSEKMDELRGRVREANEALQTWAKDMVPPQIKTAKSGTLLAEKHVALSSFFSAVMLLHRVFIGNPHRPSPLAESQAQMKSAKAATDCIRGTAEFLQSVPRSHYVVFHGQYVFVGAIVLLHCIRRSDDPKFVYSALKDVELAMEALRSLEGFWRGARKCRATVEEYLDFTLWYVLHGDRKGKCHFDCDHGPEQHSTSSCTPKKRVASLSSSRAREPKRVRQTGLQAETLASTSAAGPREKEVLRSAAPQCPSNPLAVPVADHTMVTPHTHHQPFEVGQQPEDTHFDDTIGNFLGAISPSFHLRDPYFGRLTDLEFNPSELMFLSPDGNVQNSFF